MPPPGQQGRGLYVWVPNTSNAKDDAVDEEQLDAENLFDDMAVEDNNGSAQTEEDYVDPYAAEIDDFPEDIDVDEAGIGKDNAALAVEKVT
jgi:hypothetical protein